MVLTYKRVVGGSFLSGYSRCVASATYLRGSGNRGIGQDTYPSEVPNKGLVAKGLVARRDWYFGKQGLIKDRNEGSPRFR
jgi:hypothetical protein